MFYTIIYHVLSVLRSKNISLETISAMRFLQKGVLRIVVELFFLQSFPNGGGAVEGSLI